MFKTIILDAEATRIRELVLIETAWVKIESIELLQPQTNLPYP